MLLLFYVGLGIFCYGGFVGLVLRFFANAKKASDAQDRAYDDALDEEIRTLLSGND